MARKRQIWLVPGSIYELKGKHIYNTAPVLDRSGEVVARHRKIYPFLPYESGVTPGGKATVFDVPGVGRFGLSICYDMWFPETNRAMVCQGAEVILHPSLTNTMDRDLELTLARANAITQQCYFLEVNNAGDLARGKSILVGPEGDVIHEAGYGEEIIPIQLDLERVCRVRRDGTLMLGQPLKSFRDTPTDYIPDPMLRGPGGRIEYLDSLGTLEKPNRGSAWSAAE